MEEYFSTRQIAKLLGLKSITIRRWIIKKELPAYLLGKEYRIKKSDLDKFISKKKVRK